MDKLLKESIEEYLNLFDSKNDFITKNAFKAILYHYQEVKMVDFYLDINPNELLILSYDRLHITISTKSLNYLQIIFTRSFRFNNDDDNIQIIFELHFEKIKDDSCYDKYFELSISEDDFIYENTIKNFKNDSFYKQVKNHKPSNYSLRINYDF